MHRIVVTAVAEAWETIPSSVEVGPDERWDLHWSSGSPAAPEDPEDPAPFHVDDVLDEVRAHLGRYIYAPDEDLDLLTLWAAHAHLIDVTYTTPRLLLDSPLPGSGKTTALEHLERLTPNAVIMASVSSDALLARLIDAYGTATLLIDEADRSLSSDKTGIRDLIAIINSGYKVGGTRPTLVRDKDDGWTPKELSTYSSVAMAGNSPDLPADTLSRTIKVLLLPDTHGDVEETCWELIDDDARALGLRLAEWADTVRENVRDRRGTLPAGVKGRRAECWRPLKRVALAADGRWSDVVDHLALRDQEEIQLSREDGVIATKPEVLLLQDIAAVWPHDASGDPVAFVPTEGLIAALGRHRPEAWSRRSAHGADLTAQRLGKMLTGSFKVYSARPDTHGPRGYLRAAFSRSWRSMRVEEPGRLAPVAAAGGSEEVAPNCMQCGLSMSPAATHGGFTTHPSCDGAP